MAGQEASAQLLSGLMTCLQSPAATTGVGGEGEGKEVAGKVWGKRERVAAAAEVATLARGLGKGALLWPLMEIAHVSGELRSSR